MIDAYARTLKPRCIPTIIVKPIPQFETAFKPIDEAL
jgi:hypothetical protein